MSTDLSAQQTVWTRGRFDERSGPGVVLFGRMYEDTSIESSVFQQGSRILSIASAGCTAMDLSRQHRVVAVDINPTQLQYARHRNSGGHAIRGLAEQVMGAGRAMAPLVGWSSKRLELFLELEDPVEQTAFWNQHLNTLRFRLSFDRLMSIPVLRNIYASPFLQFLPKHFGVVLRARMARCFALHSNRKNPYIHALMLGELPPDKLPGGCSKIDFIEADVVDFLLKEPPASYDGFTLSNILDGATEVFRGRLRHALERTAAPGAIVVIRSFREPACPIPSNLAPSDRSVLWGVVEALPLSLPSLLLGTSP